MVSATVPHLPPTGIDGQTVADAEGNIYRYEEATNSWVFLGTMGDPPIVTEHTSGLITPEIYEHLAYIRQLLANGASFDRLKIIPATDAYWYYFFSSNRQVRFSKEKDHHIRVELDTALIFNSNFPPPPKGSQGPRGPKGKTGPAGANAPPEPTLVPVVSGNVLTISTATPAPYSTDFALRLYNAPSADTIGDTPNISIQVPLQGPPTYLILDQNYDVDQTNSVYAYDPNTDTFTATIKSLNVSWGPNWFYKVSQRGPTGLPGTPGNPFFVIAENQLTDPTVESEQVLVSVRKGSGNTIFTLYGNPFSKVCVQQLSVASGTPEYQMMLAANLVPTGPNEAANAIDFMNSLVLGAVEMTTRDCKDVLTWSLPQSTPIAQPALVLPAWTPMGACFSQQSWRDSQFNWEQDQTSVLADREWMDCVGNSNASTYPWTIVGPAEPPSQCCQEAFFYCPNVQDGGCGINGQPIPPPPPPGSASLLFSRPSAMAPRDERCCECECAIGFDAGNFELEKAVISSLGSVVDTQPKLYPGYQTTGPGNQMAYCSFDGRTHTYNLVVEFEPGPERTITVSFDVGVWNGKIPGVNSDVCSGGGEPCGATVAQPSISMCDAAVAVAGNLRAMSPAQATQLVPAPTPMGFTVGGSSGKAAFTVRVNTNEALWCHAYRLSVAVAARPTAEARQPLLPGILHLTTSGFQAASLVRGNELPDWVPAASGPWWASDSQTSAVVGGAEYVWVLYAGLQWELRLFTRQRRYDLPILVHIAAPLYMAASGPFGNSVYVTE